MLDKPAKTLDTNDPNSFVRFNNEEKSFISLTSGDNITKLFTDVIYESS